MDEKPGMFKSPSDLLSAFAWGVGGWVILLAVIASVMALCALMGGPARVFATVGCSLGCRWMFRASRKEPMFTKIIGYGIALLLGACAVAITGVFQ